jgi:hypothetical protein
VRLVEADARQLLAQLPAHSIDLILTDPPYQFDRGGTYFRQWFTELPDEEWPAIFAQLHRVLASPVHAYERGNSCGTEARGMVHIAVHITLGRAGQCGPRHASKASRCRHNLVSDAHG